MNSFSKNAFSAKHFSLDASTQPAPPRWDLSTKKFHPNASTIFESQDTRLNERLNTSHLWLTTCD